VEQCLAEVKRAPRCGARCVPDSAARCILFYLTPTAGTPRRQRTTVRSSTWRGKGRQWSQPYFSLALRPDGFGLGFACPRESGSTAAALWLSALATGDLGRRSALRRVLLSGGQLDPAGANPRAGPDGPPSPRAWLRSQAVRLSSLPERAATVPGRPGLMFV